MDYVERVRRTIEKTVSEWADHWASAGPEKIRAMLDEAAEQIVAGVIGFSNRYGKWEVDRSHNGKDVDSFIVRFISNRAETAIHKWLDENVERVLAKPFPPEVLRGARAEYLRVFSWQLERRVRDLAEQDVTEAARGFADECKKLLRIQPEGLLALESRGRLGDEEVAGG